MTSSTHKRCTTGKTINARVPITTLDVQYPLEWFNANPEEKPILSINIVSTDFNAVRNGIAHGISQNSVPINLALTYLYLFAAKVSYRLDSDWTSYGRDIGKKDQVITPLDLLSVKAVIKVEEFHSKQSIEENEPWYALYILSIYRMIRIGQQEYRGTIQKRITEQMKAITANAEEMTEVVDMYLGWENNREYKILISAYDMFFHRFPKHKYANMRVGTTGARFKDCSALMSMGYIMHVLGFKKATDVLDWVFVEQIGDDIDRMMDNDEEIDSNFSYFPYHVEMVLVMKSAFSATANPHFFEWVHLSGTLLRQIRSMNARHISDAQAMNILLNAGCFAYAFSHTFKIEKVYSTDGAALELKEGDEDSPDAAREANYQTRDPSDWVILLKGNNDQMPDPVRRFISKIGKAISDAREGSMDLSLASEIALFMFHLHTLASGL